MRRESVDALRNPLAPDLCLPRRSLGGIAFRASGGASGEARVAAAEAERLVQGQGMPGGDVPGAGPYSVGSHPTPPSQLGEVVGQSAGASISGAQPPTRPSCLGGADRKMPLSRHSRMILLALIAPAAATVVFAIVTLGALWLVGIVFPLERIRTGLVFFFLAWQVIAIWWVWRYWRSAPEVCEASQLVRDSALLAT